jgi:hypothetical protein
MNTSTQIQPVNSLTYADVVGLNVGLTRMQGEDSVAFLERCYLSTTCRQDSTYEGEQDQICLQLGLSQWAGISISSTDSSMTITVCIGLVTVVQNGVTYNIPTVTMAPDDYWVWRMISDVVNDLNAITGVTAVLAGPDGPALQIAKQSNLFTVPSEAITMTDQLLANANVIASSLTFSVAPGSYVFNPQTGELIFSGTLPPGLSVAYQYIAMPYNLVCSELGLFGLVEPSLATVGVSSDNVLAYQLREVVQAVMNADPSYWAQ